MIQFTGRMKSSDEKTSFVLDHSIELLLLLLLLFVINLITCTLLLFFIQLLSIYTLSVYLCIRAFTCSFCNCPYVAKLVCQ